MKERGQRKQKVQKGVKSLLGYILFQSGLEPQNYFIKVQRDI